MSNGEKIRLKRYLELVLSGEEEGRPGARAEQICKNLVEEALNGEKPETRLRATEMIMDRIDGKPVQAVELSGEVTIDNWWDKRKNTKDKNSGSSG